MALEVSPKKCNGSAINLGTGVSVSIRELAQTMIQVSGVEVPLQNTTTREGDVKYSQASIEHAQKILNWQPRVGLSSGLKELLNV